MRRKIRLLAALLALAALTLTGCAGGQEIEDCLFVLAMAVDPAPDGTLQVTVKALSGTQDAANLTLPTAQNSSGSSQSGEQSASAGIEQSEPGYITLSATSTSCLRALSLLSATTPRTVNLGQLREVVLNRALAETDAAFTVLREIHSMYGADGSAIVVVTPDDAGDFIRRQRAVLGIRLSKYLEVLFDSFSKNDVIPPHAQLSAVLAAMESGTRDAACVYAAGNAFDSTLVLDGDSDTDRLPGHLPRTAPAMNEYMGSAIFSGAHMTAALTGDETGLLCLITGEARTRTTFIGGAQYRALPTRVTRRVDPDTGELVVHVRMHLTCIAGEPLLTAGELAQRLEQDIANLIRRMQAASSDAAGFGRIAIRRSLTVDDWERENWEARYESAGVRVTVDVDIT